MEYTKNIEDELNYKLINLCKTIIDDIYPETNQKLLEDTISSVSREFNFIKTKNIAYPLEVVLNSVDIKTTVFDMALNDIKRINKNYYPFVIVLNKHYILVNSKQWNKFKIEKNKDTKTQSINSIAKDNNISNNEIVSVVFFEEAKNLDMLSSNHHESPQKKLINLLKIEKKDLFVVVCYSIIIGLLSLVIPVAIQSLVNTIAFATLLQPLLILTLIVVFALSFESILSLLRTYVVEILQQRIFVRVASDLSYRLPKVKLEVFDKNHGPEMVNRFFDVLTVQKSVSTLLIDGLSILVQTVVGMILLAFYHPILLGFDLILIASILFILLVLTYGATETSIKESKIKYKVVAWLEEIALNVKSFKSKDNTQYALKKSNILLKEYIKARKNHFSILLRLFSGSLILQVFASSALLGIGGWLVIKNQLTIGQLVASEIVVASIVSGFSKFGKQLEVYYDLLAAIDKLAYLTDLETEKKGGDFLNDNKNSGLNVKFRNVSFSYQNSDKTFDKLNFEVKSGSIFGFYTLESGGKSTISELIYGLRKPNSGIIELNKTDIQLLNLEIYRESVTIASMPEIFHSTVLDNIRMGRNDISLNDVRVSLEKVGIWDKISLLPQGLETILSTGGSPLSHTNCIKLMIARAIANNPQLIIIDGIFDGLEKNSVKHILSNAFDLEKSTVFIATSNHDVLSYCNESFNLSNLSEKI